MNKEMKWVDIFGNAPSLIEWKPEQYAKNITLIYPIVVPFECEKIKLKFSNRYGKERVTISKFSIASENDILYSTNKSFSMEVSDEYLTEEIDAKLKKGQKISIRFFMADFTDMTSGVYTCGDLSGGICVEGDFTNIVEVDAYKKIETNWNYFLTDVYAYAKNDKHTIICFGDSITAQDWPDVMYKSYIKNDENSTAVVRKAVSGTRLLRQYSCNKYQSYGIKGDTRFLHESDVFGADVILIQHGINDIIHPVGIDTNEFRPWSDLPTVEQMVDMLKYYVKIAREKNMKVYMGTLLPIEGWRTYADFREELRQGVNEWIRTTNLIDGVVDFDKEVRDSINPHSFKEGFDSGDHLHPSKAAYKAMGELAYKIIG